MAGSDEGGRARRGAARLLARTAGLVLVAALCLLAAPARRALADEALLPGDEDESVWEGEGDPADPTDEDVSPVGSEPNAEQLTALLDAYLDENFPASRIPGMAVAVVDSQGVRYMRVLGDVASADDTFVIGSLSKSMTSAAVQQLVDGGAIDLDAPAAAYVPELDIPASVTVRSLLNQTSGYGYYESLAGAQVGESAGDFSYANANYDLLGRIVEDVSGMSYGDYLREHLFGPLGMQDASIDGEPSCAPAAEGHRGWFGVAVADGFVHEQGDDAWGGPSSGYVRASISDMASYLRMYLNSGLGVVSSSAVHRMVYARVPDPFGDTYYGMGWTTYRWGDGELVMSHDGDVENYVARMCVIPGRDLGIVLLADANDAVEGNSAFWQMGDDVTSLAVGGEAEGVDAEAPRRTHLRLNLAYVLAVAACAASLALCLRACRRPRKSCDRLELAVRATRAAALHVVVPAAILRCSCAAARLWPGRGGVRVKASRSSKEQSSAARAAGTEHRCRRRRLLNSRKQYIPPIALHFCLKVTTHRSKCQI